MSAGVLMDTGPLVAYFCKPEDRHQWAVDQFATFVPPVLTCEPVLTETCFLLARKRIPERRLLEKVQQGVFQIGLHLDAQIEPVISLMERYDNLPMSLADACLVRMAELFDQHCVCTLDSDFTVYRKRGRDPLNLIMPGR